MINKYHSKINRTLIYEKISNHVKVEKMLHLTNYEALLGRILRRLKSPGKFCKFSDLKGSQKGRHCTKIKQRSKETSTIFMKL